MKTFLSDALTEVQATNPIVHQITNYVTVNDCANITLAIGGSPIMADEIKEVEEIVAHANALVLNIGTLREETVAAMLLAGKKANELQVPVVLDPVGVGASTFRNQAIKKLLEEIHFSVIRGNSSEIRYLAGATHNSRGVDASVHDMAEEELKRLSRDLASKYRAVVAVTGRMDLVSSDSRTVSLENGCEQMGLVTGTGCMVTAIIASLCATFPNKILEATIVGLLVMGIAGETGFEKTKDKGTSSLRNAIIDEVSLMKGSTLMTRGRYREN